MKELDKNQKFLGVIGNTCAPPPPAPMQLGGHTKSQCHENQGQSDYGHQIS